jgi:hypothetical protein
MPPPEGVFWGWVAVAGILGTIFAVALGLVGLVVLVVSAAWHAGERRPPT